MKYSLRSLLTFSIRDIALVTVIVAVVLGWWLDHRRQGKELQTWHGRALVLRDHAVERGWKVQWQESRVYLRQSDYEIIIPLPTSQAPAQNPPNP